MSMRREKQLLPIGVGPAGGLNQRALALKRRHQMTNRKSQFSRGSICVRLKKSLLKPEQKWLAIALMLAVMVAANGKVALGQELDSGQLQKEAGAAATQQKQPSGVAPQ